MADLTKARLTGAYTQSTNLCGARLREAELGPHNLTNMIRVIMYDTTIEAASMQGADLCRADLFGLNLQRADIMSSHFEGAYLTNIDLSEATLTAVDFSKARLKNVKLRGATLLDVNLSQAYLDLQDVEGLRIIGAKGLASVTFLTPTAMVAIRKVFNDSGLRSEEKAVTSALRKFALKKEPTRVQFIEKWLLGGRITDYGAQPWSSLIVLVGFILLLWPLYMFALRKANRRSGIWMIVPADRLPSGRGKEKVVLIRPHAAKTRRERLVSEYRMFRTSLYFSLLSAFHIGWREFNIGSWITRLQPREYTLRATGWVRAVSGFQSLLSVYFLALWALTYFGRPFE